MVRQSGFSLSLGQPDIPGVCLDPKMYRDITVEKNKVVRRNCKIGTKSEFVPPA